MLQWKVDIMDELKTVGLNSNQMRQKRLFGQSTIQKMRHQKLVSWAEFDRLCHILKRQPGDLIEYVEKKQEGDGESAEG